MLLYHCVAGFKPLQEDSRRVMVTSEELWGICGKCWLFTTRDNNLPSVSYVWTIGYCCKMEAFFLDGEKRSKPGEMSQNSGLSRMMGKVTESDENNVKNHKLELLTHPG